MGLLTHGTEILFSTTSTKPAFDSMPLSPGVTSMFFPRTQKPSFSRSSKPWKDAGSARKTCWVCASLLVASSENSCDHQRD